MGPSSWANNMEAKACAKICSHLIQITLGSKSVVVITRFTAQKQIIRRYLQRMGHTNIRVTTTGALGTQAGIVLFSLTRNNPERNVGQPRHYRISMSLFLDPKKSSLFQVTMK
jgi:superfamily I DNA and/or RNA helicase